MPHQKHPWYQYVFAVVVALAIGVGVSFAIVDGAPKAIMAVRSGKAFSSITSTLASSSLASAFTSLFVKEYDLTTPALAPVATSSIDVSAQAALEEGPVTAVIESDSAKAGANTARKLPVITATSYVVMDADTGEVIGEHDSYRARPIASLTKLVTASVAYEEMPPSQRVAVSRSMLVAGGNSANFRIGEKFLVSDLLYPLLMVSSNDAAEALAQSYGRRAFIMKMNDWANNAGAYHTYFADPSGLSPLNISTARDIAHILATVAKDHPDLLDVTLTKTKSTRLHTWVNPTHFLNMSTYLGGKNGYTDEAGRTGAGMFTAKSSLAPTASGTESISAHPRRFVIVVLGSKDRDRDMLELLHFYE